jgi:hypothetical protein
MICIVRTAYTGSNVMYNPETGKIKIIDFGKAQPKTGLNPLTQSRMLGALLYEMLLNPKSSLEIPNGDGGHYFPRYIQKELPAY